jgi:hypothetical protein
MADYNNPNPDTPRNRGNYDAPHVSPVTPAEDMRTVLINRVSWGAVFSGVALALIAQFLLNLLGVGIGATSLDYGVPDNVNATNLSFGAVIWWCASGVIAAFIGGITAGRMAGDTRESTSGWHGLTSWAVSSLLVIMLVLGGAGALIGGTYNVTGLSGKVSLRNGGVISSVNNNTGTTATGTGISSNGSVNRPAINVDADTITKGALITAVSLLLGALVAWLGGRLGVVKPTITEETISTRRRLH